MNIKTKQMLENLDKLMKWYKQFKPDVTDIKISQKQAELFKNEFPKNWHNNKGVYRGFTLSVDKIKK